jgi:RNA polymerase sigma-70 factor, ECF subfamily
LVDQATAGSSALKDSTVGSASDEGLIARTRSGDLEAVAVLFRRYGRLVRNIGRRILRDEAEAEDLLQETFLYLHRKSDLFDSSKGAARSWILQVAYTQALLRRRKMKSHGLYVLKGASDLAEGAASSDHGAHCARTIEVLSVQSVWRRIEESLTSHQRETLRLHFFEGYTFREIAEKQGQSYANVRNHYYRGLEKLRQRLCENAVNRR